MSKKTRIAACLIGVLALSGCRDSDPFLDHLVENRRAEIAAALPAGTDVDTATAWLRTHSTLVWYDEAARELHAPKNMEPEPQSHLPFDLGLAKSFDTRCSFTAEHKLIGCVVEVSKRRWTVADAPPARVP